MNWLIFSKGRIFLVKFYFKNISKGEVAVLLGEQGKLEICRNFLMQIFLKISNQLLTACYLFDEFVMGFKKKV